jgi:hypothetical protein
VQEHTTDFVDFETVFVNFETVFVNFETVFVNIATVFVNISTLWHADIWLFAHLIVPLQSQIKLNHHLCTSNKDYWITST